MASLTQGPIPMTWETLPMEQRVVPVKLEAPSTRQEAGPGESAVGLCEKDAYLKHSAGIRIADKREPDQSTHSHIRGTPSTP